MALLQARLQQNGILCRALPSSYPIVRELPTKVAETFYVVQDPALFNTSYSDALLVSRGSAGGCVTPPCCCVLGWSTGAVRRLHV